MNWQMSRQPDHPEPADVHKVSSTFSTAALLDEETPEGHEGQWRVEASITWEDLPQFMADVRAMARQKLASAGQAESFQTTALVQTALRRQRFANQEWDEVRWLNRRYFFGALYRAMDRALKDHARRRAAKKRTALKMVRVDELQLERLPQVIDEHPEQVVALMEVLSELETLHPRWVEIIQHRFYGGLTMDQTARAMNVSERTVRRWWNQARVVLHDEILHRLSAEPVSVCAH
jgi:RNA polymerase sigma factor (TIGR02999 family)